MFSIVDSIRGSEGSQIDLSGYAVKNETPTLIDFNQLRTIVGGKLDSNPVNHEHTVAQVTELQAKLDAKADASHTHASFDNINVNTINNVRIGVDSGSALGSVPVVPVIKNDGVMEVGRTIDFHTTGAEGEDYSARLQLSLYSTSISCSRYFTAPNLTIDNVNRLVALEGGKANIEHTHQASDIEGFDNHTHTTFDAVITPSLSIELPSSGGPLPPYKLTTADANSLVILNPSDAEIARYNALTNEWTFAGININAVLQNHYEAIMYLANLHGKGDADTTDGPIFTPN